MMEVLRSLEATVMGGLGFDCLWKRVVDNASRHRLWLISSGEESLSRDSACFWQHEPTLCVSSRKEFVCQNYNRLQGHHVVVERVSYAGVTQPQVFQHTRLVKKG